jgi:hypothetical protein
VSIDFCDFHEVAPAGAIPFGVKEQRTIGDAAGGFSCDPPRGLPSCVPGRLCVSEAGAGPTELASGPSALENDRAGGLGECRVIDPVPNDFCHRALAIL